MTYFTNIPFSGESLGQSRPQVQGNFNILQTTISQDHVPMNNAGAGKHNQSTYVQQSSDPATAASEMKAYSKISASTGTLEFFLRSESNGQVLQLTGPAVGAAANFGVSYLPGGLKVQFQVYKPIGGVTNGALIPFVNPFLSFVSSVVASPLDTTASGVNFTVDPNATTLNNFTIHTNVTLIGVSYIAIGV